MKGKASSLIGGKDSVEWEVRIGPDKVTLAITAEVGLVIKLDRPQTKRLLSALAVALRTQKELEESKTGKIYTFPNRKGKANE